ncbi:hypothetical protein [Pectobacterium versatile]|uniref:hypothetical protein n=1 Tax=Pectobacterium versatile TaxID=2488639 RepID=UPI0020BDAB06|nr:hypothetical protein [Pectobacterium versatile]
MSHEEILSPPKEKALTLRYHREMLAREGQNAYSLDIKRCYKTVVPHLKKSGYKKASLSKCEDLIIKFVDMIFEAQSNKPFFHIDGDLPFCWNSPSNGGWELPYIKYEWGHLNSINQNIDTAHNIENLCLQSARCNQHIQSSLNVIELITYGGKLEETIERNLKQRNDLFSSEQWFSLLNELDKFKG